MRLARKDGLTAGLLARKAFANAGTALGRGVAALCNLLNLEKIILSGEGISAYDLFGPALEAAWRVHSFSTAADDCELIFDVVDEDLWATGAACLAIQNVVHSRVLLSSSDGQQLEADPR
jgi:predicted NBD/HSP70 family sugar kinase